MDVYVFVQARLGEARAVMDGLVSEAGAARAVVVTGPTDVIARLDDVSWDDLAERLLAVQRVAGVERSAGYVAVEPDYARMEIQPVPLPIRVPPSAGMQQALVMARTDAGRGDDAIKAFAGLEEVQAVTYLTGEFDLLIQVTGADVNAIASTVMGSIQAAPGVDSTATSLIVASTPLAGST